MFLILAPAFSARAVSASAFIIFVPFSTPASSINPSAYTMSELT